ncbi:acetyltransferase [Xylariales sp. AK1849]|nr:acetyltransferase [Xylariales sp. AK1849]
MAFIRPYKETDFDACGHICRATLPPSLSASPVAAKLSPYLWTHQYTRLSPSTSHVLDDGSGRTVGYCIGCPDVFALAAAYGRYVDDVLSVDVARPASAREPWTLLGDSMAPGAAAAQVNPVAMAQTAYDVDRLLFEGNAHLTGRWRATMHIDLLEPFQGQGWGRKLIERFVESVKASGADYGEGTWIGIGGENSKVVKFYERVGFRVVEKPDGERGDGAGINMVRDIEKAA